MRAGENSTHLVAWNILLDSRLGDQKYERLSTEAEILKDASLFVRTERGNPLNDKTQKFAVWFLKTDELIEQHPTNPAYYKLSIKGKNLKFLSEEKPDLARKDFMLAMRRISKDSTDRSKEKKTRKTLSEYSLVNSAAMPARSLQNRTEKTILIVVEGRNFSIPDTIENRDILRKLVTSF